MDGLALLCNLHADGPLTLRRLREAGIRSLVDLERMQSSALGLVLHSSATQARRFVEEGKLLAARLEEEPLESEAGPNESSASPYEGRPAPPMRVTAPVRAQRPWSNLALAEPTAPTRSLLSERISYPVHALDSSPRSAPLVPATAATLVPPRAAPAIAPFGLTPTRAVD